jgi:RimJ/RimL family protein N-acetyltransferase
MNPTKRLTFVPVTIDYVDAIFEHNTGNVKGYFYDFKSRDEAEEWVQTAIRGIEEGKEEYVMLDGDTFVGMVSPRINEDGTADIGMWVAVVQQRKGYGREALRAACEHLKEQGVRSIVYEVEKGNTASMALSTSIGMAPVSSDDKYHKFILEIASPPWPI